MLYCYKTYTIYIYLNDISMKLLIKTKLFLCFQWCLSPNNTNLMFKIGILLSPDPPNAATPQKRKEKEISLKLYWLDSLLLNQAAVHENKRL